MSRTVIAIIALLLASNIQAAAPTTQPDLTPQLEQWKQIAREYGAQANSLENENKKLKREALELKLEIRMLKAELGVLNAKADLLPKAPPFSLTVPPGQSPQQPGKDWKPFEYYGRTVYVVPLKTDPVDTAINHYRHRDNRNLDLIDDRPNQK